MTYYVSDIPGLQPIVLYVDVLLLVTIWSSLLLGFIHQSLQIKKHPHASGLLVSQAGSLPGGRGTRGISVHSVGGPDQKYDAEIAAGPPRTFPGA